MHACDEFDRSAWIAGLTSSGSGTRAPGDRAALQGVVLGIVWTAIVFASIVRCYSEAEPMIEPAAI